MYAGKTVLFLIFYLIEIFRNQDRHPVRGLYFVLNIEAHRSKSILIEGILLCIGVFHATIPTLICKSAIAFPGITHVKIRLPVL